MTVPGREAGRIFYQKNTGLQNQNVIFEQTSLDATARMLVDPNAMFPDGSTALSTFAPSPDGRYLAYGLSVGGSDWRELHVKSLADLSELPDTVRWVKYSGIAWTRNGKGFFYTPSTPPADSVLSAPALNGKIYYHEVGTPDSRDRLIFALPDRPDWFYGAEVTEDGRLLFVATGRGTEPNNELYVADLKDGENPDIGARLVPVYTGNNAEYYTIGNYGDTIYLQTTADAPKRKIVSFTSGDTARTHWRTVVPEGEDVLESSILAGRRR